MENLSAPARARVAEMTAAAALDPARAVGFQGAPGANSHVAALEAFSGRIAAALSDFSDVIDAVKEGRADVAMIPIENSLHDRVADMHGLMSLYASGPIFPNIVPPAF